MINNLECQTRSWYVADCNHDNHLFSAARWPLRVNASLSASSSKTPRLWAEAPEATGCVSRQMCRVGSNRCACRIAVCGRPMDTGHMQPPQRYRLTTAQAIPHRPSRRVAHNARQHLRQPRARILRLAFSHCARLHLCITFQRWNRSVSAAVRL